MLFLLAFVGGFALPYITDFMGAPQTPPAPAHQILGDTISVTQKGLPARLIIPDINVNTAIQHVGVNPMGEMETPTNNTEVGWFKLGPRPGEQGGSVVGGHLLGENREAGVFANLHTLQKGSKLYVLDDRGIVVTFVVRETRMYDPGYADDVFGITSGMHLNLITCDGAWDETKKSYTKRLVVFADIVF